MKRRSFIKKTVQGSVALSLSGTIASCLTPQKRMNTTPISICTWRFTKANETAGNLLAKGTTALDAAIAGVHVEEENIKNTTVGKGGAPDREGNVTLDASVMAPDGKAGSVVCVENITDVAALARVVMEETPHVMLAGKGAEELAYQHGFTAEELLTPNSKKAYEKWLETSHYQPIINIENHDTIGMLCLDNKGDIAGACTTSGLSYKMKGRVGDSPIIGAGLFIDNEVGGAAATGLGEEIMRNVSSFLIVELMRNGMSPQEACDAAMKRITDRNPDIKDFQIGFIAMNKKGETGCYGIHPGFGMMEYRDGNNEYIEAPSHFNS